MVFEQIRNVFGIGSKYANILKLIVKEMETHIVLGRKKSNCPIISCNYGDNSQKRCVFHPKFLCFEPKDYIG